MDSDREYRAGQVPLAGFGDQGADDLPVPSRRDGVRHVRRMSNWTLAALIAGTGAATVALAHHAFPSAATAAGSSTTAAGSSTTAAGSSTTAAAGGQAAVNGTSGPAVTHAVATTSGSGATVTTSTQTVNGRTVIVRTVHPAAYHDD
jgi:hypothetical protein